MILTQVIGHIGRDAIVSQAGEKTVINFTIAVNDGYINKEGIQVEKTTWFDCAMYREKTNVAKYIVKGQLVYVRGKIILKKWQSAGGEAMAGFGLIVEDLDLLGGQKKE